MKTYGSRNTSCIVNAVPMTHVADGDDAYMFKYSEDRATKNVGVTGEVSLSITNDDTGEVTIKLMQTSPQNAFLQGLLLAQGKVPGSVPIGIIFNDFQRGDRVICVNGWIQTGPEVSRGKNVNKQEWVFGFETITFSFGTV